MMDARNPDSAARRAMRRLLDAIDRALSAAREMELACAALDQVARSARLRIVPEREDRRDTDPD
jgi:hypothetical protein